LSSPTIVVFVVVVYHKHHSLLFVARVHCWPNYHQPPQPKNGEKSCQKRKRQKWGKKLPKMALAQKMPISVCLLVLQMGLYQLYVHKYMVNNNTY
jgi:hypothetical protein